MKAKSKLIQLINEIVPGGKYAANKLRPLLTDIMQTSLIDEYPADAGLTSADIGKLLVLKNGKASIPVERPASTISYPSYEVTASGFITLPTPRVDYVAFQTDPSLGSLNIGDTLIDLSNVGFDPEGTLDDALSHLAFYLNTYHADKVIASVVDFDDPDNLNGVKSLKIVAVNKYIGSRGLNIVFNDISVAASVRYGDDNILGLINNPILYLEYSEIYLSDVCSSSPPNGQEYWGQYKVPASVGELLENIVHFISYKQYWDAVYDSESSSMTITQVGASSIFSLYVYNYIPDLVFTSSTITEGIEPRPAYVADIYIGQLLGLDDGKALVTYQPYLPIMLVGGNVELDDDFPAILPNRLLLITEGGALKPWDGNDGFEIMMNPMFVGLHNAASGSLIKVKMFNNLIFN